MRWLPNLLTGLRLALALFVFAVLVILGAAGPSWRPDHDLAVLLFRLAFAAFAIAALTDFFDGWLARRLAATSAWGAILDPIADKVLVAATLVGMAPVGGPMLIIPAGAILMREFAVSALREVTAARGLRLPVTWLAKWKTTLQLVALAALLVLFGWPAFGLPDALMSAWGKLAYGLLWLAAVVTLITGAQYLAQARRAIAAGG